MRKWLGKAWPALFSLLLSLLANWVSFKKLCTKSLTREKVSENFTSSCKSAVLAALAKDVSGLGSSHHHWFGWPNLAQGILDECAPDSDLAHWSYSMRPTCVKIRAPWLSSLNLLSLRSLRMLRSSASLRELLWIQIRETRWSEGSMTEL